MITRKKILYLLGIMALAAMIFMNTHYVFEQDTETDTHLAFLEENLEAYADENGDAIPCWSQIDPKYNYDTVWCYDCSAVIGKGDDGESECTP